MQRHLVTPAEGLVEHDPALPLGDDRGTKDSPFAHRGEEPCLGSRTGCVSVLDGPYAVRRRPRGPVVVDSGEIQDHVESRRRQRRQVGRAHSSAGTALEQLERRRLCELHRLERIAVAVEEPRIDGLVQAKYGRPMSTRGDVGAEDAHA